MGRPSEIIARARVAWPQFRFDDAFERFLTPRLAGATAVSAEDLGLVFACLGGQPGSLEALGQHIRPAVDAALARSPAGDREDLEQALWLKLLTGSPPGLSQYAGVGSLRGWVRVAASRLALNAATRGQDPLAADAGSGQLFEQLAPHGDPELLALKEDLRGGFLRALEAAFDSLSPSQRLLLRQVIGEGATVDEVARALALPRSTAGRRLKEAKERFALALKREVECRLGTASASARQVLGLVESQLDQRWWSSSRADDERD